MHKENYNINIASFCNKNFNDALEELKSFFTFNLHLNLKNFNDLDEKKINAVIIDFNNSKKLLPSNIKQPIIFVQENNNISGSKNVYSLVVKLPLNVIQFNQDIINVCKKFEFKKNSLINIKNYILDKNERLLKKNGISLKITEKEIDFITKLYLSSKPLNRDYILKNIWNYSSGTDTHTIETHIYRLRKKIKNQFNDENFIKNSKNGYYL